MSLHAVPGFDYDSFLTWFYFIGQPKLISLVLAALFHGLDLWEQDQVRSANAIPVQYLDGTSPECTRKKNDFVRVQLIVVLLFCLLFFNL